MPAEHHIYPPATRAVLAMVLLNAFTTPLMMSATNVALPTIADALNMNAVLLGWVPMANLMASAMFVLVFGSLADNVGRKRIFLLGTTAMLLTSVLAAASLNSSMLLAARFLQGISAAMLYATQIAIVSSVCPRQHRGRMVGLVVAAIYAGLASGPLLGGLVLDRWGWRPTFLLQAPLAMAVLLIGVLRVREEWSAPTRRPFDASGALLYSGGILLLCLAVSRPLSIAGALLATGAALCIGLFLRHALGKPQPLWDVRLFFSNRVFTYSCAAALLMYTATHANVVLVSLFLQYLKHLSATETGLLMMLQPLTMALLSPLAGRLSEHIQARFLATAGIALTALGLLLLATLDSSSGHAPLIAALLLTGAGFSLFSSPNVSAIMGAVAPADLGNAAGAVATTRLLGQLASMVLVALLLALYLGSAAIAPANYPLLERSIGSSFLLAALLCLPALLFSLRRGVVATSGTPASHHRNTP